jgi:cytochrome c oxidase cbb3-type subunit 1
VSLAVTTHHGRADAPVDVPRIEYALVKAHGIAAVVALFISAIFGSLVALKFTYPDLLSQEAWLTWGRMRYDHTQGILFGWLGNAFLCTLYHMVPRLANRPVTSRRLGWLLFFIWNFVVLLPGWILISIGAHHWLFAPQPLEWAEFPIISDLFVVAGLLLMSVQFVWPMVRVRVPGGLYVSAWYIIGGTVFTLFAYPVGNFVPALVPGAQGAAFSGLWIHDAVGLFVTPFVLAIAYYVIPAATERPIYSHFLSMVGFWVLFFIYPLNGTHHYVYSAIPMDVQKAAIVASAYLGMDVILVVFNQLMSLRGQAVTVAVDVPLRFVWTGVIFYLVVSIQGSLQAMMPVNRLTHFTDWVIGHSHLAMLGFATFVAIGGIAHAWQRIPKARYNAAAMGWAYWLLLIGLLLMVTDLTAVGLVQGELWQGDASWIESVRASRVYWIVRDASALPILLAFISFFLGLVSGPRNTGLPTKDAIFPQPSPRTRPALKTGIA